jgi:hypothetical protein
MQEARDSISEYQASRAAAEEQKREAERAPVREVRQQLLHCRSSLAAAVVGNMLVCSSISQLSPRVAPVCEQRTFHAKTFRYSVCCLPVSSRGSSFAVTECFLEL